MPQGRKLYHRMRLVFDMEVELPERAELLKGEYGDVGDALNCLVSQSAPIRRACLMRAVISELQSLDTDALAVLAGGADGEDGQNDLLHQIIALGTDGQSACPNDERAEELSEYISNHLALTIRKVVEIPPVNMTEPSASHQPIPKAENQSAQPAMRH